MTFSRWLGWLRSNTVAAHGRRNRSRRRQGTKPRLAQRRPLLEQLEDRTLLSVLFTPGPVASPAITRTDIAPGDQRTITEPLVSVNPTDPGNLTVTSQERLQVTSDAGGTGTGSFTSVQFFPVPAGANFDDGDTATTYDAQGRLFWANLVNFNYGNDVAVTQVNPTTGAQIGSTVRVPNPNQMTADKEYLAADANPNSPFADNLYVSYQVFDNTTKQFEQFFSRSTDHGQSFSTPIQLSVNSGPNTEGFTWPSTVSVAPNGDVYVAYHAQPDLTDNDVEVGAGKNPGGTKGEVIVFRSTDGGATFTQRSLAFTAGNADITFNKQDATNGRTIPGARFWTIGSAQPWVLADPSRPGDVYVVTADDPNNGATGNGDPSDVVFSRSGNNGAGWTTSTIASGPANSFRLFPNASIDAFGDIVVSWYTNQNADGSLTVMDAQGDYLLNVDATYSVDGGATWATPFQVNNANDPFNPDAGAVNRFGGPPATTRIGEYFGVANYGGTAYVAWNGSTRDGAGAATGQQVLFNAFAINGSLTVNGDDGGGPVNDNFVLRQVSGNPGFIEILDNGTRVYAGLESALTGIQINGLGGNNTLTVDSSNGLITVPISFNGGSGGLNSLALTQTGGATQTSDVYSPGPNPGDGTDVITGPGGTQTVDFTNLAPVQDNVPATTATVNGTPADNAINYTQGPGGGIFTGNTGFVTVDNQESYEFNNKANLVINGLAGSDTTNLNNQTTPAGLTGSITVNGADPTASDILIVNGRVNSADTITYTPATTTSDTGSVAINGLPTVNFSGTEHLTINGQNGGPGGAGDSLTVNTMNLSSGQAEVLTPGSTFDSGHVDFRDRPGGINPTAVPLDFKALGVAGNLTFADVGRFDNLIYNGTPLNDTFSVTAGGVVTLNDQIPVSTPSDITLTLAGLGGTNTFNVPGNHNLPGGVGVQGNGPSSGDVLNFTGNGAGAVTANLGAQTVTEAGFAAVSYTGIATANVNTGANATTVISNGAQAGLSVTPTGANAATIVQSGVQPTVNVTNTGTQTVTIGGAALANAVTVNGTASADTITVLPSGANTAVQVNALQTVTLVNADTQALDVAGGLGNDVLSVNSTGGTTPVAIPITYDGGADFNALILRGTATSDTYTPGPQLGSGANTVVYAGGTEAVSFVNLAPVFDFVAAPLVVNGTNADNAINYSVGFNSLANFLAGTPNTSWGQVSVDSYEPIEFINKTTLTLNGLAGSDTVNLNNPNTPTGLTGITVDGGDPTAGSDTLIANANATAAAAINFAPTGPDAGSITGTGLATPVTFTHVEHAIINGQDNNDNLTVTTPAGQNVINLTPGPLADAGTVTLRQFVAGGGSPLVGVSFANLGTDNTLGRLSFANPGGTTDSLTINGVANASETFVVSAAGNIDLSQPTGTAGQFNRLLLNVATPGVSQLQLVGLSQNDTFNVAGNHPFTGGVFVDGDPGTLNFTGDGTAAVTADLAADTVTETGFGPVAYTGVGTVNADAGGAAVTVNDANAADSLTVTPTAANAATLTATSSSTTFHFRNVSTAAGGFAVNATGSSDQLLVEGTQNADTIDVNDAASGANAVKVNGLLVVHYNAALAHVEADGLGGSDTFNVAPSTTTTFFVDGGDPIGVKPGDTLNLLHPPGPFQVFPGPTSDSGGLQTAGFQTVSWVHIETVVNIGGGGGGPPVIQGTNGDDEITVIARDSSYNPAAPGVPNPLLDGVQDFTVSVNGGPDMLFINTPNLFIDGLSGNDDIVVQEPAPNAAVWNVQIYVAAGPPASGANRLGDNIELDTPGTQSVTFTPNNPLASVPPVPGAVFSPPSAGAGQFNDTTDASTINAVQFLFPLFYQSSPGGAENFVYNGEGGNDSLTVTTPAGATATFSPGATTDSASVQVNSLVPLTYTGLGATGGVLLSDAGGTFAYNGTPGNDLFTVAATTGAVTLNGQVAVTPVAGNIPGTLTLNGLEGLNTFSVGAPVPYTTTNLNSNDATATDPVNLAGDGTSTALVTLGTPATSTPTTVTGGGLNTVLLPGDAVLNLSNAGGDIQVTGPGNDTFTVSPTGATTATIQAAGLSPVINTTNTGALTVDPGPGTNSVTVNGTSGGEAIGVVRGSPTTVTVGVLKPVNLVTADTQALVVDTGLGLDTVNVSGTGGPASLTVNGGANPRSDTLNVTNANPGTTTVTPGATPDAGTVTAPGAAGTPDIVGFTGMTSASVTAAGAAAANTLVGIGPNGNDTLFLQHLGSPAGGTDRFWVNNQAPTSFSGFGTVTLRGLFGNDQFNVSPVGLAAAVTAINVSGTSDGNSLTVNGSAAADAITFAPTGPAAGSVSVTVPAGVAPVAFTAIQGVNLNGQGGGDALTVQTPNGADTVTYSSGPAVDQGAAQVDALVPLSFANLGSGPNAGVALTDVGGMAVDTLRYNGGPGNDTFTVNVPAGVVSANGDLPVTLTSAAALAIDGQGGSNAVTFTGSAAAQNFTLGPSPQGNGFGLLHSLGPVPSLTGTNVGQVNLNQLGAGAVGVNDLSGTGVTAVGLALSPNDAVSINGTSHDDNIQAKVTAPGVATVTGLPATVTTSGTNAGAGDTLLLSGGQGNDTVEASPAASNLFAVTVVGGPGNDTLFAAGRLFSGGGRASVDFSAATGPVSIDMSNHGVQTVFGGVSLQMVDQFSGFLGSPWNDTVTARLLPQGLSIHGGGGADQINVDTQGLRVYVTDQVIQAVEAVGSITFDLPMRLNFPGPRDIADESAAIRYTHVIDLSPQQVRRLQHFLRTHHRRVGDVLRLENITGLTALYGPLTLAIYGLTPGVTLLNPTGTTTRVVPGVPYIRVAAVNNILNPGEQQEVRLQFQFSMSALRHLKPLTYYVAVFAGNGQP